MEINKLYVIYNRYGNMIESVECRSVCSRTSDVHEPSFGATEKVFRPEKVTSKSVVRHAYKGVVY